MNKKLLAFLLFTIHSLNAKSPTPLPDDYFRTKIASLENDPTTIMGQAFATPRAQDRTLQYNVLLEPYADAQAAEILSRAWYYSGIPRTTPLHYIPRHELPELYTAVQEKLLAKDKLNLFIFLTDQQPWCWGIKHKNQLAILVTRHQLATLPAEELIRAISGAGQLALLKESLHTKNDDLLEKRASNYDLLMSMPLAIATLMGTIFFMHKKGFSEYATIGTSLLASITAMLGFPLLRTHYRRKQSAKKLKELFASLVAHPSPQILIDAQRTQQQSDRYYKTAHLNKLLAALAQLTAHYKEKQLSPPAMLAKREKNLEKERAALTAHEENDIDPRAALREQLLLPYLKKLEPIALFENKPWWRENTYAF